MQYRSLRQIKQPPGFLATIDKVCAAGVPATPRPPRTRRRDGDASPPVAGNRCCMLQCSILYWLESPMNPDEDGNG